MKRKFVSGSAAGAGSAAAGLLVRGKRRLFAPARIQAGIDREARSGVWEKVKESTLSCHCRYHLKTDDLAKEALARIRIDLTFVGKAGASFGRGRKAPPKTYKAFVEGAGILSVPAWYGYTMFGAAAHDQTVLGLPLRGVGPGGEPTKLEVTATLRSTPDFPQVQARAAVWKFWNDQRDTGAAICTLVLPCGAGKTITSVATTIPMGRRVAFLTHSDDIADQAMETFEAVTRGGLRVGRVQGKTVDVGDEFGVVVMMIPTLLRMIKDKGLEATRAAIRADTFGVVVGDECHHMAAEMFMQTMFLFSARYWLFLTATPERDDGMSGELEFLTGPIVFRGRDVTGNAAVLNLQWKADPPMAKRNKFGEVDYTSTLSAMCGADDYNDYACHLAAMGVEAGHDVILFTLRTHEIMPDLASKILGLLRAREAATGAKTRRNVTTIDGRAVASPLVSVVMSGVKKPTRDAMAPLTGSTSRLGVSEAMELLRSDRARSPLVHDLVKGHGLTQAQALEVALADGADARKALVAAALEAAGRAEEVDAAAAAIDSRMAKEPLAPTTILGDLLAQGAADDVHLVNSSAKFANPHTPKAVEQRHLKHHAKYSRVLICTVDKLKEGYNAPWKSMGVFLHARKGDNTNIQVIGRLTRDWDACKLPPFVVDMAMRLADAGTFENAQRVRKALYRKREFTMVDHRVTEAAERPTRALWNRLSADLSLARQLLAVGAA